MSESVNSVFKTLSSINVNGHTETKDTGRVKLTYLSWAWAWAEVKKAFPDANYTIYENKDGWNYHTDGHTCWVKTGVTIEGQQHIEYLPVMDFRNQSIPVDKVTSFDVNKAIQRSLTKAAARHGLGLYIYAGEDLPEDCTAEEPASDSMPPLQDDFKIKAKAAPKATIMTGSTSTESERKTAAYKSIQEKLGMNNKQMKELLNSLITQGKVPNMTFAEMSINDLLSFADIAEQSMKAAG